MNKNCREKTVIDFYVLCNKLKNLIRTGWKTWNVKRERLESVAEHVYGVQMLAIGMYSQFKYNFDLSKVLFMLAVHELEEILIGDLTCFQITAGEKEDIGHKAVEKVLSNLLMKDEIEQLILEFDERKTEESKFAYYCDKMECDIQCKLLDEEGCVDLNQQANNPVYFNDRVQSIIQSGETTWSGMWLEFDRDKYKDDSNFIKVLEYVKNNDISLK